MLETIKPSDPKLKQGKSFWYLATPYAKYPFGHHKAWQDACWYGIMLMRNGVHVFSPIAHSHALAINSLLTHEERNSHDFWMPNDLALLSVSNGVLVAPMEDWGLSKGVGMEIDRANELNLPVYLLDLS